MLSHCFHPVVYCVLPIICFQLASSAKEIDGGNLLLRDDELPGLVVHSSVERSWVTDIDSSGRPVNSYGILQEVEAGSVKARIHYAEFDNDDAARQAAEFHVGNMALVFNYGFWDGAKHQAIGDQIWHARGPAILSVLVRAGNICVLIGCREGDINERASFAEKLAEHVVAKIGQGMRIPSPDSFPGRH